MERYYWQHEDTGRTCATDFNYPPSRRWYSVPKEFYEMAEGGRTHDPLCIGGEKGPCNCRMSINSV